ncbi:uncharacterized protein LOC131681358 [Topomyia yanbarensis]|uniref:uncharacterized protein LOC131681358 n=1 Tax=Topomyia yanbarensis TaxID=2498891 RepID=UPI00273A8675|nr:uncharacterized protein LOC131681358 [Topomyia yanbarensis]
MAEKNRKNTKSTVNRTMKQVDGTSKSKKKVWFDPYLQLVDAAAAQADAAAKLAEKTPADNMYARELFMSKTNIRDVAREVVVSTLKKSYDSNTLEKIIRKHRETLYRGFADNPKYRIRDPLHLVRFESPYYEYRFFLALNKPLRSEEEYYDYRTTLQDAGVTECWVNMRKKNYLLRLQDAVVETIKAKCGKNWSGKLEKMSVYLMDAYKMNKRKEISRSKPKKQSNGKSFASTENNKLLDAILNHSNFGRRCNENQIKVMFSNVQKDFEQIKRMNSLVFDDDDLNKQYQLGVYRTQSTANPAEVPAVLDPSPVENSNNSISTVESFSSEIAQMQAEMAMTQPSELRPPSGSYFANTEQIITALEPHSSVTPMDNIQPGTVQTSATLTENSLITPGQPEMYESYDSLTNTPTKNTSHDTNREICYTLQYLRNYTNVEEVVLELIKQNRKIKPDQRAQLLDKYVNKYYDRMKHIFAENKFPSEVRLLTKKERYDRKSKISGALQNQTSSRGNLVKPNRSKDTTGNESVGSDRQNPTRITHDTPVVLPLRISPRVIHYDSTADEDGPDSPVSPPYEEIISQKPDTMPMPDSENFIPGVCSTQNELIQQPTPPSSPMQQVAETLVNRGTPLHQEQQKNNLLRYQRQSVDSCSGSDCSNVTILPNRNPTSRHQLVKQIKLEKDTSGYTGDVEYLGIVSNEVVIDDSQSDYSSQADANKLIDRLTKQDSLLCGVPVILQQKANGLFWESEELSQASSSTGGSEADAQAKSVGFRTPTSSTNQRRLS